MTRGFPEGLYVEGKKYLCELNLEENETYYKRIQGHTTLKSQCRLHFLWGPPRGFREQGNKTIYF